MKKLYNNKGAKRIHPSPPPPSLPSFTTPYLSFLPTALLALASSLSPQDQEVLAYLLDSPKGKEKRKSHNPQLGCSCFGCYKSFWARWDCSPNRQVIHLIIDEFEENIELKEMGRRKGRARKKKGMKNRDKHGSVVEEKDNVEKMLKINVGHHDNDRHEDNGNDVDVGDDDDEEEEGKSFLKKFMYWVFG